MLNEMGRFTYINPTHAGLYGYTTEELIGQSWHGLYSDDHCTNFYDTSFPVLQSQGWWQGELEGKKKNGEIFDVEVFLTLLKNEKREQKGLLCTCRDITERKQLEVAQKSSEQGIRELYEIASRYDEPWEERMAALLEMGCRRFNLPFGVLTQLENDRLRVEFVRTPLNEVSVGVEFPKDQIFCGETLKSVQPLSFAQASLTEWKNHPGYTTLGLEAYIGAPIIVDRQQYGTLAFASQESRKDEFTDAERDFIQLMVQWVG
ncbi:MAG: PAS domain-containing protein, partial [Nitrospirota bacterium]|nr:PAS domain-containing protein [Nitrospirota bacterium]